MAARVSNSVMSRIQILNVIMAPSILFTCQFSKPSEGVVEQLMNLQKQFIWRSSLSTEGSRRNLKPELLFSPVTQGDWACSPSH